TVVITVDSTTVDEVSRFHTGVTLTQDTFDFGDAGAVAAGQSLMTRSSDILNVHLMGFGPGNPEPAPGSYAWDSLDLRMNTYMAGARSVSLTACCAPGWMKNAPDFGVSATGTNYVEVAPLAQYYADYADLVAQAVERYPQINTLQVWNEMKGFWDSTKNRWNYEGYTQLYNLIWNRVKAIRPDIAIGGPYVVVGSNGGNKTYNSSVTGVWGAFDQRDLDVVKYWLKNKAGADFIAVDGKNTNRDGVELVDPYARTSKFADFGSWLRSLDNTVYPGAATLPLRWSEWYAPSGSSTDSAARKNSVMATALMSIVRSGASAALLWGAEGDAAGNYHPLALFTDTRTAAGGLATAFAATQQAITDHFGSGTQLVSATSSTSDVKVLASPSTTMLVNTTGADLAVEVNGTPLSLSAYQVAVIPTPSAPSPPPPPPPPPTTVEPAPAPVLALSPATLDFGDRRIGVTVEKAVTVTNSGTAPLTFDPVPVPGPWSVSGPELDQFRVLDTGTCDPAADLAPSDSCTIVIAFTALTASASASVDVPTNGGSMTVDLRGRSSAVPELGAAALAFGDQRLGTDSAVQSVELTNQGGGSFSLQGVDVVPTTTGGPVDFVVTDTSCDTGDSVVAGASCRFDLKFRPSAAGVRTARLRITNSTSSSPSVVDLSGTGRAPTVDASPATVSFAPQELGTVSPVTTVTLTNRGDAPLNVSTVSFSGVAPADFVLADRCTTLVVAAGGTCSLDVTFVPTAAGLRTASLDIDDDAPLPGSHHSVALSGSAFVVDRTPPAVVISAPVAGSTVSGGSITVSASASDDTFVAGVQFLVDGAAIGTEDTVAPYSTSWSSTTVANGVRVISAVARDAAGNTATAPAVSVIVSNPTVDTTAPTITSTAPVSGAAAVSQTANITATFSEAVSGLSATTFTLKSASGTAISAAVTYNATTSVATLDPTSSLTADTKYTATVSSGVTDAAKNPVASTSWTFLTGPAPTATVVPATGSMVIGMTDNVVVTFNENVTGVSTATVNLVATSTGNAVPATVTYNPTTRAATLDPVTALAADTDYTASLTAGVADIAVNPAAPFTWKFTTGPRPTVTTKSPGASAT
ncbi:MAG: beta-glucosidase/6-phospho-beta-glucosidase/beta-galactosidase, partial [Ramlibacter sp.]|nr:beta-glucosidase/6-phospho-beta-glucosidase/beta-galactosidase [Ramlibacter sp.]